MKRNKLEVGMEIEFTDTCMNRVRSGKILSILSTQVAVFEVESSSNKLVLIKNINKVKGEVL